MKLSLCMIVRDEEEVLPRCLKSAADLFDEVIVADTGSSDGTKRIAAQYGKVADFAWKDDFAAARNFAFSLATGDYLCWLDADDILPEESRKRFPELKRRLDAETPDLVMCPYETGAVFFRERFFRREGNFRWEGRVHECVAPRGKVIYDPFSVRHLSSKKPRGTRNLDIYRKWEREEKLSGRDLFYYGRELYYHGQYGEAKEKLEAALGQPCWYVNAIEACRVLAACHAAIGDREAAMRALFRSFSYGEPRAGVLCDLGKLYMGAEKYEEAAFWYRAALLCRDHSKEGDFEEPAFRGIVPALELVVCYWRLGDKVAAKHYHLLSKSLSPLHPSVRFNEAFFGE